MKTFFSILTLSTISISTILALPQLSFAEPQAESINCTSQKDTRTLEIVVDGEGCKLQYTKAGNMTVAASQIKGSEKCAETSAKIKGKLEGAGFVCK